MFHKTYKIIMWSISKTCKTLENITFHALRYQSDYYEFFKPLKWKTTDHSLHLAFHWGQCVISNTNTVRWYRHQPWVVSQRYFYISVITLWFAWSLQDVQELCNFVINSAEVKLNPRIFGFHLSKEKIK